ncbi:MAG: metal ABC transporter substrate-binding protein [Glaciimonas sp.]|nr:metal ABC transporter substrate-binding protein [Glaciimonas sp.]
MHQSWKILFAALVLLMSAVATAANKLPVVASFSILGDLVSVIGGERVAVSTMVGPNQDAHMFAPSPADAKKVAQSKLVVVNGLGFDQWLNRLAGAAGYKGAIVVASNGIKARQMSDEGQTGKMHADPHAWQDPANVIIYAGNIAAALAQLDPAGTGYYQDNRARYVQSLKELDGWASQQFAQITAEKRKVITSHDAFGYLGARYRITFLAPQGTSTESEASAKDVARLIRQIQHERIKAVYIENMSNPKLLQQLSREAGVAMGAKLYSDALSSPQDVAPTYLKMMRYNIGQLMLGLKLN